VILQQNDIFKCTITNLYECKFASAKVTNVNILLKIFFKKKRSRNYSPQVCV